VVVVEVVAGAAVMQEQVWLKWNSVTNILIKYI
jgi:hypothetical protein